MNQGSVNKFKIYCCLLFLELHKTVNKGFSLICVMAESVFCLFCFCLNLNYDVIVENMVSIYFQQFDAKSFKTFAYFDNAKKRSQIEWLGGLRCCIFWTAFRCWKLQSVVKISTLFPCYLCCTCIISETPACVQPKGIIYFSTNMHTSLVERLTEVRVRVTSSGTQQ